MINWQKVDSQEHGLAMYRAKVPGGWLVWAHWGQGPGSLTFYPDPQHAWDGNSLP